MENIIKGKVRIVNENDVNTDVIFPGKYTYELMSPEEMSKHALEDYNKEFAETINPGDFIISGSNFGCGSSREQAVTCFKGLKLGGIIAHSFARIYYRNAINKALVAIECPEAAQYIIENSNDLNGKDITVNIVEGTIDVGNKTFNFSPLAGNAMDIFKAGGLVQYTKEKLNI